MCIPPRLCPKTIILLNKKKSHPGEVAFFCIDLVRNLVLVSCIHSTLKHAIVKATIGLVLGLCDLLFFLFPVSFSSVRSFFRVDSWRFSFIVREMNRFIKYFDYFLSVLKVCNNLLNTNICVSTMSKTISLCDELC